MEGAKQHLELLDKVESEPEEEDVDQEMAAEDEVQQLLLAEAARRAEAKPSSQFVHSVANGNASHNGYHHGGNNTIPVGA